MGLRVRSAVLTAGLLGLPTVAEAQPAAPPPPPSRPQPSGGEPPSTAPAPERSPAPPPPKPSGTTTPGTTPPPPAGAAAPADGAVAEEPAEPVDLGDTWGYARSGSPRPRYVKRSTDPIMYAPNPIGFYSGVSVEGNETPPHAAKRVDAPPALLTWVGFERTPDGSRVFFQLSAEAAFEVTQKGTTIVVHLKKTKINVRNNGRELDLRYFKTPVRTVKMTKKKKDTIATIVLDRETTPTAKMISGKRGSGYKLLVLEFVHGQARRTDADRPNVPKRTD